jgi:G3E family GTPase
LIKQGLRVGVITNDQGRNLVDTSWLRSKNFNTEEILGGCFCCRFDSLIEASQKLTATQQPQVFLAEPVGSCTDLVATVAFPLRRLYGDSFVVSPISVLIDPIRALRVFGLEQGGSFSEKVIYVYNKQLEEADLIVISKCELLDVARLDLLRQTVARRFPTKQVLAVSSLHGTNLNDWFGHITSEEQPEKTAMDVDYQVYADGEALLGWLNCTVRVSARQSFNAAGLLKQVAREIQERLHAHRAEIAHLKMSFQAHDSHSSSELAAVNLVRNDAAPEVSLDLKRPVHNGQLLINLRAEAAPDVLDAVVRDALATTEKTLSGVRAAVDHLERFRPGKPTPTHRFETAHV